MPIMLSKLTYYSQLAAMLAISVHSYMHRGGGSVQKVGG